MASVAASNAAIPIPGLDLMLDIALLITTIGIYYKKFGLTELSDDVIAHLPDDVQKIISTKYQAKNVKMFFRSIASETLVEAIAVEQGFKFIPIFSSVVGGCVTFGFMLHYLLRCIDELKKAALAVWDYAVQSGLEKCNDPAKCTDSKKQ